VINAKTLKHLIKKILQPLLGLERYLFLFSLVKIATLRWDRREGDFIHFLPFVPEEGDVLDIGANIGIMTVLLAKRVKRGTVHAFEPMPVNLKTLERVVTWFRLKNVITYSCALSNEEGEVEMVMPVIDSVRLQGISHVIREGIQGYNEGDRVRVAAKRLDDFEEFFSPHAKVTAIKIDVEGFEYFVFGGARRLLSTYRPVVYCELGDNDFRGKCLELFGGLNYEVKILENNRLNCFDPEIHRKYWNFFFIPRP
jgi:FkbM family methyltransferase